MSALRSPSAAIPCVQPVRRRQQTRYACSVSAALLVHGRSFQGTCVNMSSAGLAVTFTEAVPEIAKATLILSGDDRLAVVDVLAKSVVPQAEGSQTLGFSCASAGFGYSEMVAWVADRAGAGVVNPALVDLRQPRAFVPMQDSRSGERAQRAIEISSDAPSLEARAAIRQQIGRFQVVETLGKGFLGVSYLVEDKGQRAVLKVIHPQHVLDEQARRRWQQYFAKLAELQHDHLLPILEVGPLPERDTLYVVTPYCPAGSLADLVEAEAQRGGVVHISFLQTWTAEAAAALDFLHRRRLVHTNLKPTNLLVGADGRMLVADPLPPQSLLHPKMAHLLGKKSPRQFLAPQFCDLLQQGGTPERVPNLDFYGLGSVLEYAATGALHGRRGALNQYFVDSPEQLAGFNRFFKATRQSPTASPLRAGLLADSLARVFPESRASLSLVGETDFADPDQIYRRVVDLLLTGRVPTDRERRLLDRVRVGLGVSRPRAEAVEAEYAAPADAFSTNAEGLSAADEDRRPSFFRAFFNPFDGITTMIIWGLVMPIFAFLVLGMSSIFFPLLFGAVPLCLAVLGYFFQTSREIAVAAANGQHEMPDMPEWEGLFDSGLVPCFRWFCVTLICAAPVLLAGFFSGGESVGIYDWETLFVSGGMLAGAALLSWMVYPWVMMMVCMHGVRGALNFVAAVQIVPRMLLDYLLACAFFVFLFAGQAFLSVLIGSLFGEWLGLLFGWFSYLYVWLAFMRGLGVLYRRNEDIFFNHTEF